MRTPDAHLAPSTDHCPSVTSPILGSVSLLGACVAIRVRPALGQGILRRLYWGAHFLRRPRKVLWPGLNHEVVDLRPGRQALLLQPEFSVVGKEKAFRDRSISLPNIDAVTALISQCGGKGHMRHAQTH